MKSLNIVQLLYPRGKQNVRDVVKDQNMGQRETCKDSWYGNFTLCKGFAKR